ncbi:MAG: type I glyceraldehyde-3-phosphate dehydrogenase [Candidatus Woesearchaeota archaeon]|jgi:glyceraldehyde 3-phosphate dehydrogenase|nr:type I glyceraldehyde-3-phosphate dehydrogenase [Candidatus Woesearchaeota archaeon]MDP7323091.1 type I glyceraldehyde-3-phosphate dehydrogenase [Candidatus Woesearchaeota archaeon]MDP7476056.1 type I glyceraldehyde-3-phosphate dehydrogenase [Candidatus Woesearchaeota archaeon]|tara:strand:+ start:328 stop:1317 length:990 start_codon:yes stop_codon:yes gene_type:complete
MVNIAINGFGRIGRLVFRIGFKEKKFNFVAINDLTDAKTLANLLKRDSVHGTFDAKVEAGNNYIKINGKKIIVLSEKDHTKLPWKKFKVDIVVESTGRFRKESDLQDHIKCGAKKVLLSAPGKGGDVKTIVIGANEKEIKNLKICSNASCTTNSLVPVVKVLDKEFGIEAGFMSTIHAYTNDQRLLDLPHKDLRRGRAAPINIIPTTTGAAKSIGDVFTHLKGKMDGTSFRIPIPCGSITNLVFIAKKNVTVQKVNNSMKKASKTYLKGTLEYSEEPLVSSDIIGNPHSSIFDAQLTKVNGKLVRVCAWYDNEYGFSCRMVDMLKLMTK